jgi:hypothetical protein
MNKPKFQVGDTGYVSDTPFQITGVGLCSDGQWGYSIEGWHSALFPGNVCLTEDEQAALVERVEKLMKGRGKHD